MKRVDWHFVQKYLPSKTLKPLRYEAKTLQTVERRALEPSETLEITFDRDLKSTRFHRSTLNFVQNFLSDFESELCDSLNAQIFTFRVTLFIRIFPIISVVNNCLSSCSFEFCVFAYSS